MLLVIGVHTLDRDNYLIIPLVGVYSRGAHTRMGVHAGHHERIRSEPSQ